MQYFNESKTLKASVYAGSSVCQENKRLFFTFSILSVKTKKIREKDTFLMAIEKGNFLREKNTSEKIGKSWHATCYEKVIHIVDLSI